MSILSVSELSDENVDTSKGLDGRYGEGDVRVRIGDAHPCSSMLGARRVVNGSLSKELARLGTTRLDNCKAERFLLAGRDRTGDAMI